MHEQSHSYRDGDGTQRIHTEKPSRLMLPPTILPVLDEWGQHWDNGAYYGCLKRFESGSPLGHPPGGPFAILSITATDDSALHDWRDFQQLKNLLLGPEWEAVELYPSESRLI